ncbi:MAG: glycosyltransferase [Armatimonadota bacterium]
MKISVIICTYNRADLIKGAVETLINQDLKKCDYEIIVADDGSTDNTSEEVCSIRTDANLRYFKRPHQSRSAARNYGINQANGDYILFVDDDILAPPDLLNQHLKYLERGGKIVVRGPVVNTPYYDLEKNSKANIQDFSMAFFCTCNASVDRQVLLDIGGFDENFTEYGWEDTEIGLRMRNRGYKVKFNMDAVIYHYKPKSADDLGEYIQKAEELGRTAVEFYKKHPSLRVSMATGINPIHRIWQGVASNYFIKNLAVNLIKNEKIASNKNLSYFLKSRIFNYYYHKSIGDKLKGKKS